MPIDGNRTTDWDPASSLDEVLGNKEIAPGVLNSVRTSIEALAAQITPLVSDNIDLNEHFATVEAAIDAVELANSVNAAAITQNAADIDAVEADIATLQEGQITSSVAFKLFSQLTTAFPTATIGAVAHITLDGGSHTDPVSGQPVSNTGEFRWSVSPAGWERIGDLPALLASPAFSGVPTTPTPDSDDYSTQISNSRFLADTVGLDIESVTNQLLNSHELSGSGFALLATTIQSNVLAGPDGLVTVDKLVETSATSNHGATRAFTALPVGTRITRDFMLKAAERSAGDFVFVCGSQIAQAHFNLVEKSVKPSAPSGSLPKVRLKEVEGGGGFFILSISLIIANNAAFSEIFYMADASGSSAPYAGTTGYGMYVAAMQRTPTPTPKPIVKTGGTNPPKTFALRGPRQLTYTANINGQGIADVDNILYILAGGGQSNAVGYDSSLSLVATSALYTGYALMTPSTLAGPHMAGQAGSGFADLIETANTYGNETACSGWANNLTSLIEAATGKRIRTFSFMAALPGLDYVRLKRGGADSATILSETYDYFLRALWDAAESARAAGWRPVFLAYNWAGNEASFDLAPELWATRMCQNYRNMDEDIRRITGQKEHWTYFIDSIRYVGAVANASAFAPTIHVGNQIASRRNPNIKVSHPWYQYAGPSGNAIHLTNPDQNRRGQALARAVFDEMFGTGWEPFTARKANRISATQFVVEFQGSEAGNLVMDTSNTIVTSTSFPTGNYYGFVLEDYNGTRLTITGHSISGRKITFTHSGSPSGFAERLAYATERNTGSTNDGSVTGARGCLRLDTVYSLLYSLGNAYPWCNPFIIDVAH
jgi:hypothetical protein